MATQGGLPVRAVFKTFKGPCKAYWPIGLYFPYCSWRASLVSALRASMWLLLEASPDCPFGPWFYRPHYQGFGASVKEFQKAFWAAQVLRRHIRNWDQGSPWGGAGHGGGAGPGGPAKAPLGFPSVPPSLGLQRALHEEPKKTRTAQDQHDQEERRTKAATRAEKKQMQDERRETTGMQKNTQGKCGKSFGKLRRKSAGDTHREHKARTWKACRKNATQ